jgi:hypothetical protein
MATFGMMTDTAGDARERVADRTYTIAAMVGGVGGALTGAGLGTALGIAHPTIAGVLGTMLGVVLSAGIAHVLVLPRLMARRRV